MRRYFVEIQVDHKSDEMWCGIMFKDLTRWSAYYREKEQIAYYGGRRSTTWNMWSRLRDIEGVGAPEHHSAGSRADGRYRSVDYELKSVQHKDVVMGSRRYLWDMGFGIIQGRGQLLSEVLPWYGTGDVIGILVDTDEGVVYFFKENTLVWFVRDAEIKNAQNRCKVFGCTDATDDTLVYQRVMWTRQREESLQRQLGAMVKRTRDFNPEPNNTDVGVSIVFE